MPDWILSASYALHMIATVLWVGGLVFQAFYLLPILTRPDLDQQSLKTLSILPARFQPIAWLSLAVLLGTGLTQMTAHPQYEGLLAIQNRWSIAMLAKHLSILPMAAITAFQSFFLHPRLKRELLKAARKQTSPDTSAVLAEDKRLVILNVILSGLVLILTAIARTS